jgi:hypothetical protein
VVIQGDGPIIRPDGRPHRWSVRYTPESNEIVAELDGARSTLRLRPEHRQHGAGFDRFGLFNLQVGGHFVDLTLDDLRFTTGWMKE